MNAQRDYLFLIIWAAVAATPAVAQNVTSSVGATGSGSESASPLPDFSGMWGHPTLPGFEPPVSGPGPVLNKSRMPNGTSNFTQLVGDYTNPILKPEAAEIVKRHGEISLAGIGYPTPSNQCWPGGVPYIFWNFGIQILQRPEKITIIYFYDHEVRQVHLNRPHPARVTPSWYGDSTGHYEGDTLVIDTVGIKVGPFAMIDQLGTPHSPALHVVERYRLLDYEVAKEGFERDAKENFRVPTPDDGPEVDLGYRGNALQLEFTVDDEGVFTMPWSATITYRRALGESLEIICTENTHEYYAGKNSAVPHADSPDF
jgi:hypothetical protein